MKKTSHPNLLVRGSQIILLISILLFNLGLGNSLQVAHAAVPSNDLFTDAKNVPGIPYEEIINTIDATPKSSTDLTDEPNVNSPCGLRPNLKAGLATVWYKYIAGKNSEIHADTMGSDYDTYIAVWTGPSLGSLTLVACDDDHFGYTQSQVTFNATAGTTYYIEVAQHNGEISSTSASKPAPDVQAQGGGNLRFHITTFKDVPGNYWAWQYVERLATSGVTSGCTSSPLNYCPDDQVTRAQMAVFLEKGMAFPSSFSPPNVAPTFSDTVGNWAEDWIEALKNDGVTSGCAPGLYCPNDPVTRAQMAVFLLKAKHGTAYQPPAAIGIFTDVPVGYWADKWIEQLALEAITSGCATGRYCPNDPVTRAQMAVFLVKTFSLP